METLTRQTLGDLGDVLREVQAGLRVAAAAIDRGDDDVALEQLDRLVARMRAALPAAD